MPPSVVNGAFLWFYVYYPLDRMYAKYVINAVIRVKDIHIEWYGLDYFAMTLTNRSVRCARVERGTGHSSDISFGLFIYSYRFG